MTDPGSLAEALDHVGAKELLHLPHALTPRRLWERDAVWPKCGEGRPIMIKVRAKLQKTCLPRAIAVVVSLSIDFSNALSAFHDLDEIQFNRHGLHRNGASTIAPLGDLPII